MTQQDARRLMQDALNRMAGRGDIAALRKRWPTIADADRAMSEAVAAMTPASRAADQAAAERYLARIGAKGGASGTGKAKRRPAAHYAAAGAASWAGLTAEQRSQRARKAATKPRPA